MAGWLGGWSPPPPSPPLTGTRPEDTPLRPKRLAQLSLGSMHAFAWWYGGQGLAMMVCHLYNVIHGYVQIIIQKHST